VAGQHEAPQRKVVGDRRHVAGQRLDVVGAVVRGVGVAVAAQVECQSAPPPPQVIELQGPLAAVTAQAMDEEDRQVAAGDLATVTHVEIARRAGDPGRRRLCGLADLGLPAARTAPRTARRGGAGCRALAAAARARVQLAGPFLPVEQAAPAAGQHRCRACQQRQADRRPEQAPGAPPAPGAAVLAWSWCHRLEALPRRGFRLAVAVRRTRGARST
jgi:hypothetical protein